LGWLLRLFKRLFEVSRLLVGVLRRERKMRRPGRLRIAFWQLAIVLVLVVGLPGCRAGGWEPTLIVGLAIAAMLAGVPTFVTVISPVRKWFRRRSIEIGKRAVGDKQSATVGPDSTDAEVMALIEEYLQDVSRWENEGGR
jgi:hypothetical protein